MNLEELQQIPSKLNLDLFDVSTLSKEKIRELFRTGKLPTAEALIDEIIIQGIKRGAYDIHIEPFETELRIRIGQEGVLRKLVFLPKDIHENIASVIKTKAGMNAFEKRKPQDGRFSLTFGNHQFDLRASTISTMYGERIAIRILHKATRIATLEELGFSKENLEKMNIILHKPFGLILVTGPSGSGKSTTVYASINTIQSPEKNILTVEYPIEYKLDYASQIQASPDQGLTYIEALRAILRQNPNVIMIGEIRDVDTAIVAAEAALTGNLIISTMLSSDALGTIPRLISWGVSPYWISSTLTGVVYQILVRKICESCKEQVTPEIKENMTFFRLLSHQTTFYEGKGCEACGGTGYRGRTALHEILIIDDRLRDLIYQQAPLSKMKEATVASGFNNIYQDAAHKIAAGIISVAECTRALG